MKEEYYDQAVACVKDYVLPAQRELYKSCGGDFDKVYFIESCLADIGCLFENGFCRFQRNQGFQSSLFGNLWLSFFRLNRNRVGLPGLLDFYRLVIRDIAEIAVHARWEFGKHPTETAISDYVGRGMMYITEKDAGIIAAVAVTPFQPEDYHGVEWQADLADDEVAAVHILAVNPRSQGRGYAKQMMRDVIDLSKGMGKKAVRLDALACNAPAHRLYESLGFKKRGVCRWYAENTGWFDFYLFECLL